MIEKCKIINKLGLHARASSKLVQVTNKFESEIFINCNGIKANAKSILGILSLAASCGTTIEVEAIGSDCKEAMNSIKKVIEDKFGESE